MTALELFNVYTRPEELVGRWIMTECGGQYPGGLAEVIEIMPDPDAAPEITFQVRNPLFQSSGNPLGQIGVFAWEEVQLINREMQDKTYPCVMELPQACTCS